MSRARRRRRYRQRRRLRIGRARLARWKLQRGFSATDYFVGVDQGRELASTGFWVVYGVRPALGLASDTMVVSDARE